MTVDMNGVNVTSIDDALFARGGDSKEVSSARQSAQSAVDIALTANIAKQDKTLSSYMKAPFTLGKYDRPHLMKF
jgi:hypothetical protein